MNKANEFSFFFLTNGVNMKVSRELTCKPQIQKLESIHMINYRQTIERADQGKDRAWWILDITITFVLDPFAVRWSLENHASMMLKSNWNSTKSVGVKTDLNRVVFFIKNDRAFLGKMKKGIDL